MGRVAILPRLKIYNWAEQCPDMFEPHADIVEVDFKQGRRLEPGEVHAQLHDFEPGYHVRILGTHATGSYIKSQS